MEGGPELQFMTPDPLDPLDPLMNTFSLQVDAKMRSKSMAPSKTHHNVGSFMESSILLQTSINLSFKDPLNGKSIFFEQTDLI